MGEKGDAVKRDLKVILKSAEFRKLYVPEVKLIPPYNRNNQTRSVQEKSANA